MKRILLLIATNVAVMLVLSIVVSVLGLDRWLMAEGINYASLLAFSAVFGFGGAFISLLMSKFIAKMSVGGQTIDGSEGSSQYWLVQTVHRLADAAGVGHPEVAIYEGPPNAFATGAFKDSALVAVSTGLLQSMSKEEVEAVLGHEISHVANGDMVTLTLIQGVLNTFVFFLSRVVGFIVDKAVFRTERGVGPGFYITMIVSQIVFGILASAIVAWFSRYREFRADRGSANLLHTAQPMIAALRRLGGLQTGGLPDAVKTFGISSESGLAQLFATHPPIEARIAALQEAR
ncbi:MAG TPA: protease HtpX [Burkholderiales bacterium]|jgi:heat shock protein HtpX|nr:protease HtpX [Burkholderiales bacterium]